MVRAWYMPDDEKVTSQFEQNFVSELSIDRLLNEIGVAYFNVNFIKYYHIQYIY
jgi:hypothetical protein